MTLRRVHARLVTTHLVDAYGGFKLERHHMVQVAEAMRSGAIPMHLAHDASRPMQTSSIETGVEQLPDGEWADWAEFDVDSAEWADWEVELSQAGAGLGGMSITLAEPYGRNLSDGSMIAIYADATTLPRFNSTPPSLP